MPQRSALLVLGLGIVAACNGAAKVAMDAGGDGPTADGPTTDAGSEAEAGLIDGQPSDASGDTLSVDFARPSRNAVSWGVSACMGRLSRETARSTGRFWNSGHTCRVWIAA
jgi:hypothetical protein